MAVAMLFQSALPPLLACYRRKSGPGTPRQATLPVSVAGRSSLVAATAAPLAATATRAAGCGTSTGVRTHRIQYMYACTAQFGGSHLQGCPLDPVLSWDGLGCPWDGTQPCRVTRWPGPGSQRRRRTSGRASGRRLPPSSLECGMPVPHAWPVGLLAVACWPAVLSLLAVSLALGPSPIQQTEYAIGLPYSQPSQSRLQRPSRPHLARFWLWGPPVSQQTLLTHTVRHQQPAHPLIDSSKKRLTY